MKNTIIQFLRQLSHETNNVKYANIAKKIKNCPFFTKKQIQGKIKTVPNYCGNTFCPTCIKKKRIKGITTYYNIAKKISKYTYFKNIIFKIPDIDQSKVKDTLDKATDAFAHLIRFFEGSKKIKHFNLSSLGYLGAIKILNFTNNNDYAQIEINTLFFFNKPLNYQKDIKNSFSENDTMLFSKFECLLQRIWCLLMMNVKVTKENIINIETRTNGRYIDGFLVYENSLTSIEHYFYNFNQIQFHDYKTFKSFYFALENKKKYTAYGIIKSQQKDSCGIL